MARIWFAHPEKDSYSSTCCCDELKSLKRKHAVVAQLVEHHLAKVDVASSSLVNRSTEAPRFASGLFRCLQKFLLAGVLGIGGGGAAEIPEGVSLGLGSVDRGAAVLSFLNLSFLNLFFLNPVLGAVREERIFKKFWGAKRAGERWKPLSEPPGSRFEG